MNKLAAALLAGAALASSFAAADAKGKVVGVSWSNFQEERWKTDEAAMKAAIAAAGDKYISADAQSSAQKQLADIESMIAQGANVLIVLAQDSSAIAPAVQKAVDEGIPVIGYDRLIENPNAFYITFDNKEVGRMQARAVFAVKPTGNYAFIKGSSTDPNADFLFSGQIEVLKDAIASRQDQKCRRGVHRRLAAGQCAEKYGADPDQERQQDRCGGRFKRRHRRRRHRRAVGAGHGRRGAGVRSGRRSCRAQPRRAWHADGLGVEGRPRAWQKSGRNRGPPRRAARR